MKIKNKFPVNKIEIDLIKFIAKFQYLCPKDIKYFCDNTYFSKRVTRLIKSNILKRYNKYLVLGENGYHFMKILNKTVTLYYDRKYVKRLKAQSHLAAIYYNNNNIVFTPSFEIKDKANFTETSRRYFGILIINKIKYLIYYISEEHTQKYINSVVYDLQKENKYNKIIIFVNNIQRINLNDFAFGFNSVLICENIDLVLENLKYLNQINWNKIINYLYDNKVHLSEYTFCDYISDNKNNYISFFEYIDTEKINKIKRFLLNNPKKQVDIICNKEIYELLNKEIPIANYQTININDFKEKDFRIYEEKDNF